MLRAYLFFVVATGLTLAPSSALAKAWQGINPGTTKGAEVIAKFGEPSTQGKRGGKSALVYKQDKAISGTKQAQFFLRTDGTGEEISVFPSAALDKEAVEGTYGKNANKTFTDDFLPVWIYKGIGIVVFFNKEGTVDAITFKLPEAPGTTQPEAK